VPAHFPAWSVVDAPTTSGEYFAAVTPPHQLNTGNVPDWAARHALDLVGDGCICGRQIEADGIRQADEYEKVLSPPRSISD